MINPIKILMIIISALSLSFSAIAADKDNGHKIYRMNCAGCHGISGDGNGPAAATLNPKPTSFVSIDHKDSYGKGFRDYSKKELLDIVMNGRKGTSMPLWKKKLSREEIEDVLAYVISIQKIKENI